MGVKIARSLSGTPFFGKGQNEFGAFVLQNRMMLDLSSGFKVNVPTSKQLLDVFTSVIFTEVNNYWVMWLFRNGTQSEAPPLAYPSGFGNIVALFITRN